MEDVVFMLLGYYPPRVEENQMKKKMKLKLRFCMGRFTGYAM